MMSALAYLLFWLVVNRLRVQLRRLRKPKYLAGALVGGLYVYFFFLRQFIFGPFHPMPRGAGIGLDASVIRELLELGGAALLWIVVLFHWIVPQPRATLAFTEAEIAFLFPAPISRRGLIHYKLLKSQLVILFSILFLTLFSSRFGGLRTAWMQALGWWLILSTLSLHFLGASFTMSRLFERGIMRWQTRLAIAALAVVFVAIVILWTRATIPSPGWDVYPSLAELCNYVRAFLQAGPAWYLLFLFRWLVRPFLAPDARQFLAALGPALVLLLAHYAWVLRADVSFEEASLEYARKRADLIAQARAGNWHAAGRALQRRRAPFSLPPTGTPVVALLWKNLISARRLFSGRLAIVLACLIAAITIAMSTSHSGADWRLVLGMVALMMLAWLLLIGPQILRVDMRQDLPVADILKMYPLRGWQVIAGELLAPVALLTLVQWLLLGLTVVLFTRVPGEKFLPLAARLSGGVSLVILAPMLNLIMLSILNAACLLFPAWVPTGPSRPRGIEAIGQQLIFMAGQMLVFILALIPAAVAFALVFFSVKFLVGGPLMALPIAAVAAAILLALEVVGAVAILGRVFERMDISTDS